MRLQTTLSAQPSDVTPAVSDSPILSKPAVTQQDGQIPSTVQSHANSGGYQSTRFANEAAQEAELSNGDSASGQGQYSSVSQVAREGQPAAPVARGLSDTPWLSGEAEQTSVPVPAQQHVLSQQSLSANSLASSGSRRESSLDAGAGRLQEQPQSPGQGLPEQPLQDRSSFDRAAGPGLSGVKQVIDLFYLSLQLATIHGDAVRAK